MAVDSSKAMAMSSVVRMFLAASGCRAMACMALITDSPSAMAGMAVPKVMAPPATMMVIKVISVLDPYLP